MTEQDENLALENCSDDDALSFESGMFKAGKLREKLWYVLKGSISSHLYTSLKEHGIDINPGYIHRSLATWKWFREGIECELLRVGSQGWQKGKVKLKVCLEFIPDEHTESPMSEIDKPAENNSVLDDIRQSIA